jgi:hypothetical protein
MSSNTDTSTATTLPTTVDEDSDLPSDVDDDIDGNPEDDNDQDQAEKFIQAEEKDRKAAYRDWARKNDRPIDDNTFKEWSIEVASNLVNADEDKSDTTISELGATQDKIVIKNQLYRDFLKSRVLKMHECKTVNLYTIQESMDLSLSMKQIYYPHTQCEAVSIMGCDMTQCLTMITQEQPDGTTIEPETLKNYMQGLETQETLEVLEAEDDSGFIFDKNMTIKFCTRHNNSMPFRYFEALFKDTKTNTIMKIYEGLLSMQNNENKENNDQNKDVMKKKIKLFIEKLKVMPPKLQQQLIENMKNQPGADYADVRSKLKDLELAFNDVLQKSNTD